MLREFRAAISSSGKAEEGGIPGAVWRLTTTRPGGEIASEKHQFIVSRVLSASDKFETVFLYCGFRIPLVILRQLRRCHILCFFVDIEPDLINFLLNAANRPHFQSPP
jgi:hypothetical protein